MATDWTDFKNYLDKLIIKDLRDKNKVHLKKHVARIYGDNQQLPEGLTNFYSSLLGTLSGSGTMTSALGNETEVHKLPVFQKNWEKMWKIKKNTYYATGDKLNSYTFPNNVYDCLKNIFDDYIEKYAQRYVELMYEPNGRALLIELNLRDMGLKGYLNLEEFAGLKKIDVSKNQITDLKVENCPNLVLINSYLNNLKKLDLTANKQLKSLDLYSNPDLTELKIDYSQLLFLDTWKTGLVRQYGNNENEATQWFWNNIFRNVERNYPEKLAQGIMKLVDIKEIDKLVEEFDWEKFQESEEYRSHFCQKDTNLRDRGGTFFYHINNSLKYLSQQVLAKCLIKQNELAGTATENWKRDIENIAKTWENNSINDLSNPREVKLEVIQPAVDEELAKINIPQQEPSGGTNWLKWGIYGIGGVLVIFLVGYLWKKFAK